LFHCPDIEDSGDEQRPGIIHRLDKDTSGILVVAKTSVAHTRLSLQFKNRTIRKEYLALVWGQMEAMSGQITFPIGRHYRERKKMSINSPAGRSAETLWGLRKQFSQAALLHLHLKTGRTHQIRVHCAAIGHSVMGDNIYGRKKDLVVKGNGRSEIFISRQMLHAWKITFLHPIENIYFSFNAPVPDDMRTMIHFLNQDKI
jgi:23S rRNA pseudouridine1911/1915/1917 synthase